MRRSFIRKFKENKVLVIVIGIVVMVVIYFLGQKFIDEFVFNNEGDIVIDDSFEVWENENAGKGENSKVEFSSADGAGMFSDEELDLVVEDGEENVNEGDSKETNGVGERTDGGNATDLKDKQDSNVNNNENWDRIYVYITGEVNSPGVVILNEGARIVDAINSAGGATVNADVSKVNLVFVLEDGMKVNIPNSNDLKDNPDFEYITMNSGDGRDDYYLSDGGENSNGGVSSDSMAFKANNLVNINSASQTELESLPGIGPSLALRIINYRKVNGKFSSIDEIKNVSGIAESKFNELKAYITV